MTVIVMNRAEVATPILNTTSVGSDKLAQAFHAGKRGEIFDAQFGKGFFQRLIAMFLPAGKNMAAKWMHEFGSALRQSENTSLSVDQRNSYRQDAREIVQKLRAHVNDDTLENFDALMMKLVPPTMIAGSVDDKSVDYVNDIPRLQPYKKVANYHPSQLEMLKERIRREPVIPSSVDSEQSQQEVQTSRFGASSKPLNQTEPDSLKARALKFHHRQIGSATSEASMTSAGAMGMKEKDESGKKLSEPIDPFVNNENLTKKEVEQDRIDLEIVTSEHEADAQTKARIEAAKRDGKNTTRAEQNFKS